VEFVLMFRGSSLYLLKLKQNDMEERRQKVRPFKDDPDFDIFSDEEMRQAQELLGDQQTFVQWRGEKFAFIKKLRLVLNPPATLLGRRIAGFDC